METEYSSLALLDVDLTWITFLLKDIGTSLNYPSSLFTDNISSLHLMANLVSYAPTKHIDHDYRSIREKLVQGAMVTTIVLSFQ